MMLLIHLRTNGEDRGQVNLRRPRIRGTLRLDLSGEKDGAGQLNLKGAKATMSLVMNLCLLGLSLRGMFLVYL